MTDAWRLAIGTLTRFPVRAPSVVDRTVAGRAMGLAPIAGALLALICLPVLLALDLIGSDSTHPALTSTLVIALLAALTRAMHLDGIADTADALGSGRPASEALDIARRSDIGPFGVVTLVFTLLLQIVALALCIESGVGLVALALALIGSRIALTWACTPLVPAARPDGLGAMVAGTVPVWIAAIWTVALLAACAFSPMLVGATVVGALGAGGVLLVARRRLGGVTGDVLGAVIEVTFTAILVALALLR